MMRWLSLKATDPNDPERLLLALKAISTSVVLGCASLMVAPVPFCCCTKLLAIPIYLTSSVFAFFGSVSLIRNLPRLKEDSIGFATAVSAAPFLPAASLLTLFLASVFEMPWDRTWRVAALAHPVALGCIALHTADVVQARAQGIARSGIWVEAATLLTGAAVMVAATAVWGVLGDLVAMCGGTVMLAASSVVFRRAIIAGNAILKAAHRNEGIGGFPLPYRVRPNAQPTSAISAESTLPSAGEPPPPATSTADPSTR